MKPSFYSAAQGLLAHQQNLNNIGNNIANVNTAGYKNQVVGFEDLLYNRMYANTDTDPLTGHGVRAVDAGLNFGQGTMRHTSFELDYAVVGDAMFAVSKNGQTLYTRDGQFAIKLEGDNAYLTALDGSYVLGKNGERIGLTKVPGEEKYDTEQLENRIGIYRVNNPTRLTPLGGNYYGTTELSGAATLVTDESSKILPGYVEGSNTILSDEMTNMIAAQRAYQVSARVLQVSDENEQTINNLRR